MGATNSYLEGGRKGVETTNNRRTISETNNWYPATGEKNGELQEKFELTKLGLSSSVHAPSQN